MAVHYTAAAPRQPHCDEINFLIEINAFQKINIILYAH